MEGGDYAITLEPNPRPCTLDYPTLQRHKHGLDIAPCHRSRYRIGEDGMERSAILTVQLIHYSRGRPKCYRILIAL